MRSPLRRAVVVSAAVEALSALTDVTAHKLCSVGCEQDMAFAAVVGPPEHERVVATNCHFTYARPR